MAYTQADLDRIDRAILGEELEVEVDGTRVKYRNMAELLDARKHVQDVMVAAATRSAGGRTSFRYEFTTTRE